MLRPADCIDDGRGLFHVAVFPDGREKFGGFQKLVLRNSGDSLHHLRCVARILLLQKLIDRPGVLERDIMSHVRRQRGKSCSRWSPSTSRHRTLAKMTRRTTAARPAAACTLIIPARPV